MYTNYNINDIQMTLLAKIETENTRLVLCEQNLGFNFD